MKFLFDIVHPAHVHFYKHMIAALQNQGHVCKIVARHKDVTTRLLDSLGLQYETVGKAAKTNLFGLAGQLLERDWALLRLARSFRPDLIVTRSPAGAQVGRLLGVRSVFDTDDGRAAGIHYWASAPFAHVITTPDCTTERHGKGHITYPGYKQSAYLHPDHFTPNPETRAELGVSEGQRLFLVRFVDMMASHDVSEQGLATGTKHEIVQRLKQHGKVFLTQEAGVPSDMKDLEFPLPPDRMHDALAAADMLIGDSQTMAAEAAVLGTPSLRVSSWAGRLDYLRELEQRYRLTFAYTPEETGDLLKHLDRWLDDDSLGDACRERQSKMLRDKENIALWYTAFLLKGAPV